MNCQNTVKKSLKFYRISLFFLEIPRDFQKMSKISALAVSSTTVRVFVDATRGGARSPRRNASLELQPVLCKLGAVRRAFEVNIYERARMQFDSLFLSPRLRCNASRRGDFQPSLLLHNVEICQRFRIRNHGSFVVGIHRASGAMEF